MPRVLPPAVVAAALLAGCASLDAGRIVVVSTFARLERGRPTRPGTTGESWGAHVGAAATLTRPSGRLPPRPEAVARAADAPRRAPACASRALCTFEAVAVRDALARHEWR